MQVAYHILTSVCVIASVISVLRISRWWVKGWDVGRVYLAGTMAVLAFVGVLFLPLQEWWVIAYLFVLLAGVIYHFRTIYPFTPFHPVELEATTKRDSALKILTVNVRLKNNEYQRLVDLVEKINPEVLLLTEVNRDWIDAIIHLKKQYPYTLLHPQENTYGIALFSKYPLKDATLKFLVEKDIPSIHATLLFKGKKIQFLGLHPRPPAPSNETENKDLELIKLAAMVNINLHPTIVGGDLNDVGWSKITQNFKQISGLLDPRVGRGFYNTYNALIPFARIPVDHFFVSKHFKLLEIKRLNKIGSDHFPVLLEVNLEE